MFRIKNLRLILVLLSTLLAINVSPLPVDMDDEEGTIVSDNPKIEGEDKEIDDPTKMYSENLFDGDVELTEEQKNEYKDKEQMRSGAISKKYRWPKTPNGAKVIIPYKIQKKSGYSDTQLALIHQAMDDIEKHTCIQFRKYTDQKDYIQIYSGDGCNSRIGKTGGMQKISLNMNGCMIRKKIVHELIHAIGFNHMHKRFDRDEHVTIQWENIEEEKMRAFERLDNEYEAFNTKYDLLSCMHYAKRAFSKNEEVTIITKKRAFQDRIGNETTLSIGDVRRINRMYKCPDIIYD